MKMLALLTVLIGSTFAGVCDTSTCRDCIKDPQCGWFGANTSTGFADCRKNDSVPAALASTFPRVTPCPMCQAGTCSDCQNQTGCSWFSHTLPGVDGVCFQTGMSPPNVAGAPYALVNTCPRCVDNLNCTSCYGIPADKCGWYELAGVTGGKCAEASPGFAYSKKADGFCSGNVCAGLSSCSKCKGAKDSNNNTNVCSWYVSKVPTLYNSKCDQNSSTNVVNKAAYDEQTTACAACDASTCIDCAADTTCKWVAVTVATVSSFGQCIRKVDPTPGGKTTVAICPKVCDLHSCAACTANTLCRWYVPTGASASLQDAKCDRAADAYLHPFTAEYPGAGVCPTCVFSADRCFECGSLPGCGWYLDTVLGQSIPGTGDCATTANPGNNKKKLEITDKKCDGNPNSASSLAPGLAVVALLMFYN